MAERLSPEEIRARLQDINQNKFFPLLADPLGYQEGHYTALTSGGGIIRTGLCFQFFEAAHSNADMIEVMVLLHQTYNRLLEITYHVNPHSTPPNFPIQRDYVFLAATIADFHGVRHNFDRNKFPEIYRDYAQRVYADLRPKQRPGYQPPPLYQHPGFWADNAYVGLNRSGILWPICGMMFGLLVGGIPGAILGFIVAPILWLLCYPPLFCAGWLDCNMIRPINGRKWIQFAIGSLIIGVIAAPPLLYLVRAALAPQAKLPWEYDYQYRYGQNHAYDNLGKTAKDYTEIVRAFKAKYPEKFAEVAESYDVRNHLALPSEINLFINNWVSNTDEAQRLMRANENISQSAYRNKPGWITIDQATAIIVREAKKP